jgi:hypothetical protein
MKKIPQFGGETPRSIKESLQNTPISINEGVWDVSDDDATRYFKTINSLRIPLWVSDLEVTDFDVYSAAVRFGFTGNDDWWVMEISTPRDESKWECDINDPNGRIVFKLSGVAGPKDDLRTVVMDCINNFVMDRIING